MRGHSEESSFVKLQQSCKLSIKNYPARRQIPKGQPGEPEPSATIHQKLAGFPEQKRSGGSVKYFSETGTDVRPGAYVFDRTALGDFPSPQALPVLALALSSSLKLRDIDGAGG
jgi:hypothetical protein